MKAEQDAAPAGGARNPALGRPRDPTGRHYGRSAGSLLDWDRAKAHVPGSADPGTEIAASGAPRGAFPRSQGGRTRCAKRVGRLSPSRSRGLANPCVSRRSAPPQGALNETTAYPGPVKNTGDDACAIFIPPPKGGGIRKGGNWGRQAYSSYPEPFPRCVTAPFLAISTRFPVGVKRPHKAAILDAPGTGGSVSPASHSKSRLKPP